MAQKIGAKINEQLNKIVNNKVFGSLFTLFVVSYSHYAAPKLSTAMKKLFDIWLGKIVVLTFVLFMQTNEFVWSFAMASIFVLTFTALYWIFETPLVKKIVNE